MRLEAVRIVADWLGHPSLGVNARLAVMPLDGGDPRPAPVAAILDETRHAAAAFRRFDGVPLPALLVLVTEDAALRDGEILQPGDRADATLTVTVRYATRAWDAATAMSDGYYVSRAVIGALRRLHDEDQVAARTRGAIRLVSCERLTPRALAEEVEDTWLLGAVEAQYYVVDLAPYAT